MGISAEAQKIIEQQKKLLDQFIVDPNFLVPDVQIEPFTPHLRTNNFVQRGLSQLLGKYATNKKWYPVAVDDEGKLVFSDDLTKAGWLKLGGRESATYKVFDSLSVPASGVITHDGIDVSDFGAKLILISTTGNSTIYVQFSDDNVNWYDWCDAAGTAISWTCNNVKKSIGVNDAGRYFRIVLQNTSAAAITVTCVLVGVV